MRLVTNKEMQTIDRWSMRKLGIPGTVLMENAGRGCVDVLEEYFELEHLPVLVVCGKGNNGGDGFVIARHLQNRGAEVKVILVSRVSALTGDALLNYRLAQRSNIAIIESMDIKKIRRQSAAFNPAVIIDALFGTGFAGNPRGLYRAVINFLNESDSFILSVDIPSGVNGDTGRFADTCVIADVTATMCLPKRGNYLYPGREMCGDLFVVDIGIPYDMITTGFPQVLEYENMLSALPMRPPDGHKGTFGNVLVIAGARGFSGAAAMASIAALKTGTGLVRLAAPRGIMNALESKLLEVVKIPLPETREESIGQAAIDILIQNLAEADTVVIGPGITAHSETAACLRGFLPRVRVPLIIDADALNILAQSKDILRQIRAPFILTPHPGELSRLTGITPQQINDQRIDIARTYAKKFGGVLVLKGAPTVVATPAGEVYVNPTGNSGLASAGAGDVLVGMISGFLGQQIPLIQAACLGVFLHGLCADLALEKSNEYSLMAGDIMTAIPDAINYLLRREYRENKCDE